MRFVDANVFIYHLSPDARHGPRARAIILRIENGEKAVTSTHVLQQVPAYFRWRRRPDAIPAFLAMVRSLESLGKEDTTYVDIVSGAALQARTNLPWSLWDDLVIAAQMERLGLGEIYSADADFDRIPGVRRVF